MDPVRVGVLGCASIARRRVLPALAAVDTTRPVAVASRSPRRAAELAAGFGCAATGYEELLARPDVEAVYVPVPAALHARWVRAALFAGKHVLAEKPLTTDARQTAELAALAEERGLVLRENFMFLHHAQHAAAARLLADGALGELRSFEAAFTIPALPPDDIRHRADLGGGALLDVGVYPLRIAQFFLGAALEVVGAELTGRPEHAVERGGSVVLRSPAGVEARLAFGMEHAYRSAYALHGSGGSLSLDRAFTPPADHRPVLRLTGPGGGRELVLAPDDQCANTVRAFAAAVRGGRPGREPLRGSLALARLVDDVRNAAARA
ncbi:Gfo/Idh/MocA family oxidoreductase [Streptomyces sp. NPDC048551]|uniref:Gfo/Idh/MocA family protein n=1 Tax=Streptomyces sp. NPDC048551 TaxID=3155758 RepID=UPI003412DD66